MKFRAWDKELNEMLYPDDTDKILFEINEYGITTYDVRYLDEYGSFAAELDSVVMQSTGLKDTNGKEIFEGDIIDKGYSNLDIVDRIGYVKFGTGYDSDGWAHGKWTGWITNNEDSLLDVHEHCTVLGNKFQNKDLLEEE